MYNYLLKAKNEYEYCILTRHNQGEPFISSLCDNIFDLKRHLNQILERKDRYNQIYYVDNDFFNNYYRPGIGGTYYQVLKRPVNDWQIYSENAKEENNKDISKNISNNILYFS